MFVAKLAIASVVAIAALVGAVLSSRGAPAPIHPKPGSIAVAATAPAATRVPRSASPADSAAPSAPAAAPEPEVPVTRATSPDFPDSSAPPLEDTVERALPAIVMIETPKTRGSGFFIKPDLIVTNAHVVAGFLFPTVTTQGGMKLNGKVAQLSDQYDIALVQVPRPGPADAQLPLGQSASVRLGQGIVALGWAQSLTQSTLTRGIVTGLRRDGDRLLIQTDAAPNHGDSGGPVLDRRGEVIGVTTFRADNGTSGYAVAIDDVKPLVEQVVSSVMTVPLNGAAPAVPAARQSDMDLRRSAGLQRYANTLSTIARSVGDMDASWSSYKASCWIANAPPGQTHEWFYLYDPQNELHRTVPRCAAALAEVERRAALINASMTAAAEVARQADVYPGALRDLRRQYRLDYAGWDR